MKSILLLNPQRKGRNMKTITRRRSVRRASARRIRRNPPKMTPAMRAKISRAVKASIRARKFNKPTQSSGPVVRYRNRTVTRVIRRSAPVRGRVVRRRRSRGSSLGGFNLKSILGGDTLKLAGGTVGAAALTTFVLSRFGASLPMANTPYGMIAYKLAIPLAGAYLVRRMDRKVAEGMVIGGVVLAINQVISMVSTPTPAVATTGEYLTPVGALPPGESAVARFGGVNGVYDNSSAFASTAWDR